MPKKKKTAGKTGKPPTAAAETVPGAAQEGPPEEPAVGFVPPIIFHPPIFININPAIGSLTPAGAVVGGSDFTLTVLGSNFGSASTVLWNQSPRATTLVSSTQLTAAITAADLAAIGTVTVVVSNQGAAGTAPVVSAGVAFNIIPSISQIIAQLQNITPAIPPALLTDLNTYVTIQQSQIDTLNTQVSTDQTTQANLQSQISNLQTQVAQQQTTINSLQAQVQAASFQTASPLDVAQSFKSVVDQIQQTAQTAGGTQTTVTKMNVQLKSLVNVQAATANVPASASLVFPDPTTLASLDAGHLSTLSLSFGAIPNLQAGASGGGSPPAPATPSASTAEPKSG